jgi:hypothetical protein
LAPELFTALLAAWMKQGGERSWHGLKRQLLLQQQQQQQDLLSAPYCTQFEYSCSKQPGKYNNALNYKKFNLVLDRG